MKLLHFLFSCLFVGLVAVSCGDNTPKYTTDYKPTLPESTLDYLNPQKIAYSEELGNAIVQELNNQNVTNEGATLGRVLFYDKQLSINNKVSCASCHLQEKAFADPADFSKGFEGAITPRNSMAVVNPIMLNDLFWDGRSPDINSLVSQPIQNHIEMGMERMDVLAEKVGNIDYYPSLFKEAFGSTAVTEEKIVDAMSQYLKSMVSFRSKFDQKEAGQANFTSLETAGEELFLSADNACGTCHTGTNFSAPNGSPFISNAITTGQYYTPTKGTANIGLDLVYTDQGFGQGKFKIPTLRNIELSGPYMHDGRYETLDEVINHYNDGVKNHPDLDGFLKDINGDPKKLELSDYDKEALIAFLHTLTDWDYVTDERFSDPFES